MPRLALRTPRHPTQIPLPLDLLALGDGALGPVPPKWLPWWVIRLMRQDATLKLAMRARRALLLSADIHVECESDEVRVFIRREIDALRYRLMRTALRSLDYGYVVDELVWGRRNVTIETVDKDGTRTTSKRAWVIDEVRDHPPWQTEILVDAAGDFRGVKIGGQGLSGKDVEVLSRTDRLALYSHEEEFGRWQGDSAYLSVFWPWVGHNVLTRDLGVYMAKKADPTVFGLVPDRDEWAATRDDGTEIRPDPTEWMNTVLINLYNGDAISIPSAMRKGPDQQPTDTPLFDIKVLDVPERRDEFTGAMDRMELLMMRGLLVPDLVVAVGDSPGQAGAKQGGRLFHATLRPDLEEWAEATTRQVVRPLVAANFPDAPPCRLRPGLIAENKLELLLRIYEKSTDALQFRPDGSAYLAGEIVAVKEMLAELGVPTHDEDVVARDPSEIAPPNRGPGRPPGRPPGPPQEEPDFDSDEEDKGDLSSKRAWWRVLSSCPGGWPEEIEIGRSDGFIEAAGLTPSQGRILHQLMDATAPLAYEDFKGVKRSTLERSIGLLRALLGPEILPPGQAGRGVKLAIRPGHPGA